MVESSDWSWYVLLSSDPFVQGSDTIGFSLIIPSATQAPYATTRHIPTSSLSNNSLTKFGDTPMFQLPPTPHMSYLASSMGPDGATRLECARRMVSLSSWVRETRSKSHHDLAKSHTVLKDCSTQCRQAVKKWVPSSMILDAAPGSSTPSTYWLSDSVLGWILDMNMPDIVMSGIPLLLPSYYVSASSPGTICSAYDMFECMRWLARILVVAHLDTNPDDHDLGMGALILHIQRDGFNGRHSHGTVVSQCIRSLRAVGNHVTADHGTQIYSFHPMGPAGIATKIGMQQTLGVCETFQWMDSSLDWSAHLAERSLSPKEPSSARGGGYERRQPEPEVEIIPKPRPLGKGKDTKPYKAACSQWALSTLEANDVTKAKCKHGDACRFTHVKTVPEAVEAKKNAAARGNVNVKRVWGITA